MNTLLELLSEPKYTDRLIDWVKNSLVTLFQADQAMRAAAQAKLPE